MGDRLKPLLPVAGEPLLLRVLTAVVDAEPVVVVGPAELAGALPDRVRLTREEPAGQGPVAGIAAGARLVGDAERIAVVGADLPFLSASALAALRQKTHQVALYVDDEGRRQLMVTVWEGRGLRHALGPVPPGSVKELIGRAADVAELAWTDADPPPWYDCDTPEDLAWAESRLGGGGRGGGS